MNIHIKATSIETMCGKPLGNNWDYIWMVLDSNGKLWHDRYCADCAVEVVV